MRKLFIFFLFCLPILSFAGEIVTRTLNAQRTDLTMKIDGSLDEEAWVTSQLANKFTTLEPTPGLPANYETEVRILYDDYALYIGAFLIDPEPEKIMKQIAARDQTGNASNFVVVLDPYQSGINGFGFSVTSAGVQSDFVISNRGEDDDWDAVWKSEVSITEFGWIVEMEIPFSALRFPDSEMQDWNINFGREVRRTREVSFWNPINPTINGFLNQSGRLIGIKDIKTPVRLMLTPYLSYGGSANMKENGTLGTGISGGADLKYGINDAFTLDMTLVPDFSQVRFDNQVLNLSPFEVQFNENRAFFTEGTELFNKANLFYSRRIGGAPHHLSKVSELQDAGYEVTKYNTESQLINASKVSGRTEKGLGLGVFNAIVGMSNGTFINDEGNEEGFLLNPLTNYSVVVGDQQLKNNSYFSMINTNVTRFGEDYDANVTGTEFAIRNKKQSYMVSGSGAISQKYYSDYSDFGGFYDMRLDKTSGTVLYGIRYREETPNYDINDLGFIRSANERSIRTYVRYNNFSPRPDFINRYSLYLNSSYNRLVDPNVFTDFAIDGGGFLRTSNFIGAGFNYRIEPVQTYDYFEPRTDDFSKYYTFPTNFYFSSFLSTNYNNPIAVDLRGGRRVFNEPGRNWTSFRISPRWNVSDQVSLRWSYDYSVGHNDVGFVTNDVENIDEENPVVFGIRDRNTMENSFSARITFNRNMFINIIGRHYWASVNYDSYHLLNETGNLDQKVSLEDEDELGRKVYDQNYNLLNMDLVYNWRFAPGSDLVFVVKNFANNGDDPNDLRVNYYDSVKQVYQYNNNVSVNLKVLYFIDYYKLVKGRV